MDASLEVMEAVNVDNNTMNTKRNRAL